MSSLLIYAGVLTASSSSYTCVQQTTAQLVQWFCCVQETVFKKKSGTFFFPNYYLIEIWHMNPSFYFLLLCAPSLFLCIPPANHNRLPIFWILNCSSLSHTMFTEPCVVRILKKAPIWTDDFRVFHSLNSRKL